MIWEYAEAIEQSQFETCKKTRRKRCAGVKSYMVDRLDDVGDSMDSRSTSEVGRSRCEPLEVQCVASKTAQASHSIAIPIEYSAARNVAEKPEFV